MSLRGRASKYAGQPGWVYAIRIRRKQTKIGLTYGSDPNKRLATIRTAIPQDTALIGVTYSLQPVELEEMLHRCFGHARIGMSEWFNLINSEVERLRLIAHLHPPLEIIPAAEPVQLPLVKVPAEDARDPHTLLTQEQVADILQVPYAWVCSEVRNGRLPSVTFTRIDPKELKEYLNRLPLWRKKES